MTKLLHLRPLDDRVVVKSAEAENRTPGGLHLPDKAQKKPQRGTVISVGPGKLSDAGTRLAMSLKVGDVVMYDRYAGADVEVDGQEFKILSEGDILATLED